MNVLKFFQDAFFCYNQNKENRKHAITSKQKIECLEKF